MSFQMGSDGTGALGLERGKIGQIVREPCRHLLLALNTAKMSVWGAVGYALGFLLCIPLSRLQW